jgi:predicted MFS family arabinose efflux permease
VPAGLALAQAAWQLTFVAVAALLGGAAIAAGALLAPMRGHIGAGRTSLGFGFGFLARPLPLLALAMLALTFAGNFLIVPNVSAYVQFNLGLPRGQLHLLYLAGGAAAFVATRAGGRLVDRGGAAPVTAAGTALLIGCLAAGFAAEPPLVPIAVFFVLYMVASSLRMVSMSAVTTRVPAASERARYLSAQSAVQHASAAGGAALATGLLGERADHALVHMPALAWLGIAAAAGALALLVLLERRLALTAA